MAAKRKRDTPARVEKAETQSTKKSKTEDVVVPASPDSTLTVQIVTGSYDRVLHGFTATIPTKGDAKFADTFLFNAHNSAIRCVALSPPSAPSATQSQKVMLATGSTDERINVYSISAHPPKKSQAQDVLSSVASRPILENSKNREVGTLMHHSSTVTKLAFPTRSKLLSASEDSTIAVTRSRDWSLLSTIKAPKPKVQGRPSGDTAPMGGTPSGINDFAIDPSMKVMISVSKGERSMRLWNLVTGKKAGVLNFSRDILQDIGEGKHSTGEGRKVVWGNADEFAVGFDRNILVFGMDCTPRCKVMPDSRTKVHELAFVAVDDEGESEVLAVSTEDGRIMFFSTKPEETTGDKEKKDSSLPTATFISQLGGKEHGVEGRIKDFAVLPIAQDKAARAWIVVAGCSDGKVRLWKVAESDLRPAGKDTAGRQVGKRLGTYETHNRITCVAAFVMIPRPEGLEESEDELEEEEDSDSDSEGDD
ncbi:uncharacterized protein E0L32_009571 [Thyridium curvatum]|uniref:Uncharacterized protein n=1 Tax=Thyridium curvatum TaxID=1093900 RepID=A0A507AIF2_9PEZI|nr:uncharacterized protein E0L32_009571 [Thyridium curvatum]TPX08992.1 hypothetical protein E0L32_009571 [Thyridium curvatum]